MSQKIYSIDFTFCQKAASCDSELRLHAKAPKAPLNTAACVGIVGIQTTGRSTWDMDMARCHLFSEASIFIFCHLESEGWNSNIYIYNIL